MPIASVNLPVPSSGDGLAVSVASLVQAKTVILSGFFRGSYTILANHVGGTFAPVLLFNSDGTEEIRQTLSGAFSEMKVRANAGTVQSTPVTVQVSAIQEVGANLFKTLATLPPGFTGLSPVIDLAFFFPPTGLEDDVNVICLGGFEGTITVLGSIDGIGFNPVGTFQAAPAQRNFFGQAQILEFAPLPTFDLVRYLRLNVQGRILSPTIVTVGGAIFTTSTSTDTLAGAYNNGSVATDQTIVLTNAHGGGVVIQGSGLSFTFPNAFSVLSAAGGSAIFPRVGGFDITSSVTAAATPGAVWNEVDLQSSAIALTGPPSAVTSLAMVHVGRGIINAIGSVVGDAYNIFVDQAPGGMTTLTRSWSLGAAGPVQVGAGLVLGAGLLPPGESDLVIGAGATVLSQVGTGRLGYVGGATQRFAVSENGGPYELLLTTGSFPTLTEVYTAGTTPADQTMTLTTAEGGGIVIDGSGGPFTGTNSFSVLGTAGNAINFPRLGGISGAQDHLLNIFVPDEGTADADGKGITITADAGGSGGTGNHAGGNITLVPGAAAGSGLAGIAIVLGDLVTSNNITAFGELQGVNLTLGPLGSIGGVIEINFSGAGGTIRTDTPFGSMLDLQAFDTFGLTYPSFISLTSGNPPTCVLAGAVTGTTQIPGTNNTTLATTAFVHNAAANFTQGSVPFASATGSLTEDNAEFFWDDTNKLLGVGTNGPSARLTVTGSYADVAGTRDHMLATATFAPAGGTAAFNQLNLAYTIDQTGGSSGRIVGVRIAATETAIGGLHYPIDVFAGAGGVTEIFRLVNDGAVQTKRGLTLGISLAAPGESDLCVEAGATIVSEANTGRFGYLAGGTQQFMVSLNGAAYVPLLTGPAAGGFTQGSVPFGSAAGTLAQDNANFFWQAANATLQLGGAGANATSTIAISISKTLAAPAAGSIWDGLRVENSTLTATMGAGNVTITELVSSHFHQPTITTAGGAGLLTITDAYTVRIGAPPVGTGSATLTNAWSLGVIGAVKLMSLLLVNPAAVTSGTFTGVTQIAAAHTNLTAGTEVPDTNFNLSATKTWATGAVAIQRDFIIQARTYAFAAASTVTTGATFAITGAPALGPNASITNPLAFWVQSGNSSFIGKVGIRILNPSYDFQVNQFRVDSCPSSTGANNLFAGDATGILNTTGLGNTAYGSQTFSANTTGHENSTFGWLSSLLQIDGYWNAAFGAGALMRNVHGTELTAVGSDTLSHCTVSNNTAVGSHAMEACSTGTGDAFGRNALLVCTVGTLNSAFGNSALSTCLDGSNNCAFGTAALNALLHSHDNAAFGVYALLNCTASNTIAVGSNAGSNVTSGAGGVYLGHSAQPLAGTDANVIVIGNAAVGVGPNTTVVGNSSTLSTILWGNLGLGLTSPDASSRLHVVSTTSIVAAAGATWNGINFAASTLTLTGATTPVTALAFFNIAAPAITAASAVVTTDFYTCKIGTATFAGAGPASITRNWSLGVDGNVKFGGGQTIFARQILIGASPYPVVQGDYALEVQSNGGAITLNLPALTGGTVLNGTIYIIIDSGYNAAVANITFVRGNGGDKINNVAASYVQNISGAVLWLKANTTTNNWEFI